jgi:hypothetical protein
VNNNTGQRQYAEITVNGKTGPRSLPLIDSLPYIKDYLNSDHPQQGNPNAILKEATLRVFSGWTADSDMPRRYTHLFENAACEDILEAYGLLDKGIQLQQQLRSKQCPNCNEPNKPDSKFCAKCKMILSYDAYSETLEDLKKKDLEVQSLREKHENDMKSMREEMNQQFSQVMEIIRENPKLANVKPEALTKRFQ